MQPLPVSFDLPDGPLTALRFGDGPRIVLAVHGITANAMSWAAVADALGPEWTLVALDLRGRGGSRDLPGPFGLRAHARDVGVVAAALEGPVVLAGHSMGAYVAVHAGHEQPDLYSHVVLVDGGVALPLPAGSDPDAILAATLGPALERLGRTYDSLDDYVDVFRAHPALGPHWNDTVEAYARYDALPVTDGVRARAVVEAVREDGRDLLVDGGSFDPELRATPLPIAVLAAPAGMFGDPPGLLQSPGLAALDDVEHASVASVPDVNHYTILFDPVGAARVAAAIGER